MRLEHVHALILACAALAVAACEERTPPPSAAPKPAPVAKPSATPLPVKTSVPDPDDLSVSEIPEEATPAPAASGAPSPSKLFIEPAVVIGPAGQMAATEQGVVLLTRDDEVLISKRSAHFPKVKGTINDFFAVARGPLVLRGKAYWVKEGKLVRRALDNATPLESLAGDARNGTRVVGADLPDAPAHALYIDNPSGDAAPRAKLWVEGAGISTISPEGAGASSVAAVASGGDLFVVAIDARSAMTPMHGRRVHFKSGQPELGPDVVMWVGATSQTFSEVFAGSTPLGVRAFLPIERDTSHFGLVMLDLGTEPHMDPRTLYHGYPNGIDVAPVASVALCGSAFVAFVRPETRDPDQGSVLEIAEITANGLGPPELVDKARGFSNVSLASATSTAVLAYVADFRTFATTLRCNKKK